MRTVILADVHSNYQALTAVLLDARRRGPVNALWCLGDIVGYGPDPHLCIELLQKEGALAITGNHDLATLGKIPVDDFNEYAAAASQWTAQQLTEEDRNYLEQLPLRREIDEVTLVHGSPREPVWEYLVSEPVATASLPYFTTPVCLVGHSHIPLVFQWIEGERPQRCRIARLTHEERFSLAGKRVIYNPGGVGQPRDGDPRAAYAIYDAASKTITHFRVPYDIATTQARMAAAGLALYLIQRLAVGR